ncbi:SRPBCC domain-containing protein [Streptomyces coeruleoprunus]|uniref:SRPBCC domain-containing protein n=1 Tax=Streptomyces coeruleoprunus TaxID=285563 RepID=A0ABV9XD26_9ACTN
MEHEVFVPVAVQTLRDALADPARVARCVPGLQQDADASAGPLSGRLRVRVGGHTITYRGALRVVAREDGAYAVEGEGTEARGTGTVKLALTLLPEPAEGGTTLAFTGTAHAEGRLAELPHDVVTSAAHRLLDRFGEALGSLAEAAADAYAADDDEDGGDLYAAGADDSGLDHSGLGDDLDAVAGSLDDDGDVDDDGVDDGAEEPRRSVFDTPVPPSSLDPLLDDEFAVGADASPGDPGPEAAHARRTMIGRSAEEVDHAPPRGRYAPQPGPDTGGASGALRWLVPAAALAVASAVVVGRALRRRK